MKPQLKFYGQMQKIHISKYKFVSGYTQILCSNSTATYMQKQGRTNSLYPVCMQDAYWGFQCNVKTLTE